MKKGQQIEGIVTRIDFPNKGIVTCDEGVCVVKNALPGQKVRAVINKARKGKAEGRLLEVVEPSASALRQRKVFLHLCSAPQIFLMGEVNTPSAVLILNV